MQGRNNYGFNCCLTASQCCGECVRQARNVAKFLTLTPMVRFASKANNLAVKDGMNSLDRMRILQEQAGNTFNFDKQQEVLDNRKMEQAIEDAIEDAGEAQRYQPPEFNLEAEIDKEVAFEQEDKEEDHNAASPPQPDPEDEGLESLAEDAAAWEAGLQEELLQESIESPSPLTPTCTPTGQGRTSRALRIRENVAAWGGQCETKKKGLEKACEEQEEEEEALHWDAKIAEEAAEVLPQERDCELSIEAQIDDAIDTAKEDEIANDTLASTGVPQRTAAKRRGTQSESEEENLEQQIAANVMKEMPVVT